MKLANTTTPRRDVALLEPASGGAYGKPADLQLLSEAVPAQRRPYCSETRALWRVISAEQV